MVKSGDYDEIGVDYVVTRQPDPRISYRIIQAIGNSASVVNVGAGAGSYEPKDLRIIAVEPSRTMIRQRAPSAVAIIQGAAERLPLVDSAVDAAIAILTVHHWTDIAQGLTEMRRVARNRVVILTWDQEVWKSFWLFCEYLPSARDFDQRRAVAISDIEATLGSCKIIPVPIPHDCIDGFHGAFWRRPEAYLDSRVRSGISTYAEMPAKVCNEGLQRLAADIASGAWKNDHRELLDLKEHDLGYRLVVFEKDANDD